MRLKLIIVAMILCSVHLESSERTQYQGLRIADNLPSSYDFVAVFYGNENRFDVLKGNQKICESILDYFPLLDKTQIWLLCFTPTKENSGSKSKYSILRKGFFEYALSISEKQILVFKIPSNEIGKSVVENVQWNHKAIIRDFKLKEKNE